MTHNLAYNAAEMNIHYWCAWLHGDSIMSETGTRANQTKINVKLDGSFSPAFQAKNKQTRQSKKAANLV